MAWNGYKSLGDLKAELTMSLPLSAAIMAVEGKDDMRFWDTRKRADCYLVEGASKRNVVDSIRALDAAGGRGVLGVVDTDYDTLLGLELASTNLVATDAHDLECLLCRAKALDRLLVEYGSATKIATFETSAGHDVRTGLLKRALPFGRLRWLVAREELSFEIQVRPYVNERAWTVDEHRLLEDAQNQVGSTTALAELIARTPAADPWYVVHGKDIIEILRIGLRRVLGHLPVGVGPTELARSLRLAMADKDLAATGMWQDMRAWETRNHPYMVLP